MKNFSYLHIGGSAIIDKEDILGIFDLDKITVFKVNRNYLSNAQKKGRIVNVTNDLPKSCIVCSEKSANSEKVYLSSLLTSTLLKRSNSNTLEA